MSINMISCGNCSAIKRQLFSRRLSASQVYTLTPLIICFFLFYNLVRVLEKAYKKVLFTYLNTSIEYLLIRNLKQAGSSRNNFKNKPREIWHDIHLVNPLLTLLTTVSISTVWQGLHPRAMIWYSPSKYQTSLCMCELTRMRGCVWTEVWWEDT